MQLYIKNQSVFGDYLCKAQNKLGTLDQIITLQEGTKPAKPRELRLKGANSDTLTFDIIGPEVNTTEMVSEMGPIGYRIQYRLKDHGKWTDAGYNDFDLNDGEYEFYPERTPPPAATSIDYRRHFKYSFNHRLASSYVEVDKTRY